MGQTKVNKVSRQAGIVVEVGVRWGAGREELEDSRV